MLLAALTHVSRDLRETSSRTQRTAMLADAIRSLDPRERASGVHWLAGEVRQQRLDIGWRGIGSMDPPPRAEPVLTVAEVDAHLQDIANQGGEGSTDARRAIVGRLLARATAEEQAFLRALISGNLRHGAMEGQVLAGIAAAAGVPLADVQRAQMFAADLGAVTNAAMEGQAALRAFGLRVGHGIQPMLAASSEDPADVVDEVGEVIIDHKLDGIRIQVHRDGHDVAVFSRNLNDLTERMPEAVTLARSLDVASVVLDGEVLAIGPGNAPRAFQETMSAAGRDDRNHAGSSALMPFLFDVLHLDGNDLMDMPLRARLETLDALVDAGHRVHRLATDDRVAARAWFIDAVAAGQEGVVMKAPDSAYAAGRRGKAWRKVKPFHTLDLVVLAVEWGSGRRRGKLSNLHLGVRDPGGAVGAPGSFVMLGKTFKGMTDELLEWQTKRFLELEIAREGHVVHVQPIEVVEIAIDGVQASPRYPGGVALRFARVVEYRPDKAPGDADTIENRAGDPRRSTSPSPEVRLNRAPFGADDAARTRSETAWNASRTGSHSTSTAT